jgi:hypothetical protein
MQRFEKALRWTSADSEKLSEIRDGTRKNSWKNVKDRRSESPMIVRPHPTAKIFEKKAYGKNSRGRDAEGLIGTGH